ncbi:hypothetical protein J2847_006700 [Azospirillum agricola]|uniref:hypothetical protein n=1 Tax=Azospirillum agricola TaxID=1720247 RepID=UPI001AE132A5|nr:hypothetical protein [Azospirillum agricola]MBP2233362.1 hypothetical protein [Azospirillum agricola]
MEAILLDAIIEANGEDRWISHARRPAHYTAAGRYQGTAYTCTTVVNGVDALHEAGLIEVIIAPPSPRAGWQSVFRASPLLRAAMVPNVTYDPGELIRLKIDKKLTDYKDTDATIRRRCKQRELNEPIEAAAIALEAPGVFVAGPAMKAGNVIAYPARKTLYRVFAEDFEHGGRHYGGWWQGIPGELRESITIDGEPTVEPDYSQHHARLLYRVAGKVLDGDAYTVDGYSRDIGKIGFQALINASSYAGAVGAVAKELALDKIPANPRTGRKRKPAEWEVKAERKEAHAIVAAVKRRNAAVGDHFHKGVGMKLQRVDSDMAADVLKRLRSQNVVALPIHDSFIVKRQHEGLCREAMDAAFAAVA